MGVSSVESVKWEMYQQTVARTHATIDLDHDRSPTLDLVRARAQHRIERVKRLLAALGNPQNAIPLVHVAGTSGKGSTATAIASMLIEAGYRTGLHTSPYLQVSTEKLQIDRRLMAVEAFAARVDRVSEIAGKVLESDEEPISYGELWLCMTFDWFAENELDIGVIEVGAGGRFDLTNVFTPVVSVITPIGIDHIDTLGSTVAEIAWHKAGIIKPGVPVALAPQGEEAMAVVQREAMTQHAEILLADMGNALLSTCRGGRPELSRFERTNLATAIVAIRSLRFRELAISEHAIERGIAAARIPGRLERMPGKQQILLDGAHNPQKMGALVSALDTALPREPGGRRIALFGVLEAKDLDSIVATLAPDVDAVVCTEPSVYSKEAASAAAVASAFRNTGFDGQIDVEPVPQHAFHRAISTMNRFDSLLVTGSMYLVGNVRENWYSSRKILVQRTSWPESSRDF